jgi:H+-translocating NAD(P) transhydrogenase subunit alpha
MSATTTIQLFVFLLAGFVGVQTINRIPPLLHTPLMAATNAISGISLVASLVLAGGNEAVLATVLGTIGVACAVANIVGGFLITDRMLAMFKRTQIATEVQREREDASSVAKS